MQKYKKAALNIAFLTLMLSGGLTAGHINADPSAENEKNAFKEEIILYSFENNDYETWKKTLPKKSKIQNVITKNDFEQFITARKLARAGKYDQAIQLSTKLENDLKLRMYQNITL
jgi:hypothetical protein